MKTILFYITSILCGEFQRNNSFQRKSQRLINLLRFKKAPNNITETNEINYRFDGQLLKERLNVFTPHQEIKMKFLCKIFKKVDSKLYLVAPKGILGFEVAYAILIANKELNFITEKEKNQIKNGIVIKIDTTQTGENIHDYYTRISKLIRKKEKAIIINDFIFPYMTDVLIKKYCNFEKYFIKGIRIIRNSEEQSDEYLTAQYFNTIITNNGESKDYFDDVFTMQKRFKQFYVIKRKKCLQENNN